MSKFYLNKSNKGQYKSLSIRVLAKKKDPKTGQLSKDKCLGIVVLDLSQYLNKTDHAVDYELKKPKVTQSYLQFKISII